MACADFEDLLLGYPELSGRDRARIDAHAAECSDCRLILESAQHVDLSLDQMFESVVPSPGFRAAVRSRIEAHPSRIPELLDAVAWASIGAILLIVGLVYASSPELTLGVDLIWVALTGLLSVAGWSAYRSFVELSD